MSDSDEEIDESREPREWREVEDTINDEEDSLEDVFITTVGGEANESSKPLVIQDEFQKGKPVDPLGLITRNLHGKTQSIDDEDYNPVGQLSTIHQTTSFTDLVRGMHRLNRKLSSQEADIKQLVRDNFDRFISCKDVIDGIYERISENEQSSTSGNSTRQVEGTLKEVLQRAHRVYDPLLLRKAETDKIRQSLSVLSRFAFLFTLPSKIVSNIKEGEYDKAVQHYKKAVALFLDQTSISHVSVFMHVFAEVENIVAAFRTTLYAALADPNSSFDAQERVIRILVDLARPTDFHVGTEKQGKEVKDDPGWYYLNMASSRMISRLSSTNSTSTSTPTASPTLSRTNSDVPPALLINGANPNSPTLANNNSNNKNSNNLAQQTTNTAVYKSVRSACGHVARHLPNLWKMGQHYLEGRFDPKNYGSNDKDKEEMQAHPQHQPDKEKFDKNATVRVFFSDETTTVRVDSRKPCMELVELCLRRVEGDHSSENYAIFSWIEKRKKDGTKVIKITELGPGDKAHKLHKKWGDKSGVSHRFLFKRKDEKFPKIHDPRTIVEDYTLEMRSTNANFKKSKSEAKVGKKSETDFLELITSVLTVFSERVEFMFFQDNSEDDYDNDLAVSLEELTEEWAFGKMRSQVLDVVTTVSILQRAGMTEKYLAPVTRLSMRLSGHYVSRVCGQWAGEVALLYLSVPENNNGGGSNKEVLLDSTIGLPIVVEQNNSSNNSSSSTHLPSVLIGTTKFYLAQFKGIISKGHPMLTQVQAAFGESLKCFADTLHYLAFDVNDHDDLDDERFSITVHQQLRIVSYILETRNVVVGSLWSHFNELFKLVSNHQVEEEVLSSPFEVFQHLGNMTIARYIHDRLTTFNKIVRDGIVISPATDWSTTTVPTGVSEYAMSILLHFVFACSELSILEPPANSKASKNVKSNSSKEAAAFERGHHRRESRQTSVFDRSEKQGLLEGTPEEVIKKLVGALVWGTMEGFRRSLDYLDRSSVSVCGVYQLRLDFCFMESILSRYMTEDTTNLSKSIHAILSQFEEDAYQDGAGEEGINIDLDAIIEDTSRRAVVLFGSLTGDAEAPAQAKLNNMSTPKRTNNDSRRNKLGADMKFGNSSKSGLADLIRKGRTNTNIPASSNSKLDRPILGKERSTATTNNNSNKNASWESATKSPPSESSANIAEKIRERDRERAKEALERRREREAKLKEEQAAAKATTNNNNNTATTTTTTTTTTTSSVSSNNGISIGYKPAVVPEKDGASTGSGEMSARELEREKLKQRQKERLKRTIA